MTNETFNKYLKLGFKLIKLDKRGVPIESEWTFKNAEVEYDANDLYGVMPPYNMVIVDVKNNSAGLQSWKSFLVDNYDRSKHYLFDTPNVLYDRSNYIFSSNFRRPISMLGGMHYYLYLNSFGRQKIRVEQPSYPGMRFISHRRSMAIAGEQSIDGINYVLGHVARTLPELRHFENLSLEPAVNMQLAPNPESEIGRRLVSEYRYQELEPVKIREPGYMHRQELSARQIFKSQIIRLLSYIPAESYYTRDRVGMALLQSERVMNPREEFHKWFSKSPEYSEVEAERQWSYLKEAPRPPDFVSISTLVYLALQHAPEARGDIDKIYKISDLERVIAKIRVRFIRVESVSSQTRFYDTQFGTMCSSTKVEAEINPVREELTVELGIRRRQASLNDCLHYSIITNVHDKIYSPDKSSPYYRDEKGKEWLNIYNPSNVPKETPWIPRPDDDVNFFLKHIEYLFGKYKNDFMDYIAHLVQKPGHKIRYMIILQGNNGIGKSLISKVIENHVIGSENCNTVGSEALVSQYNQWAFDKQLIFVEELRISSKNSESVINKIKTLITEEKVSRDEKFVKRALLPCSASFIALTNYRDCIPLSADNRRYHPILSPLSSVEELEDLTKMPSKEYFSRLGDIASKENPNGGQLRNFFSNYKISPKFSPNKRPEVSDLREVRLACLNKHPDYKLYIKVFKIMYEDYMPDYISIWGFIAETDHAKHPNTSERIFQKKVTQAELSKFAEDVGYTEYRDYLYSNQIAEDKAMRTIDAMIEER